jgi:hypothetical protein
MPNNRKNIIQDLDLIHIVERKNLIAVLNYIYCYQL